VPIGSLDFWQAHLTHNGIKPDAVEKRFDQNVLSFNDPDGMRIELIESDSLPAIRFWEVGPIPQAYALHGFHSVTLWQDDVNLTADLLIHQMGYQAAVRKGTLSFHRRCRYDRNIVDVIHRPGKMQAGFGAGQFIILHSRA